jgi:MFS transporter, DHA1 family, purine base/nucleoside efflux pump
MDKRIWLLVIAVFVVGTVEMVVMGIIDMIGTDLGVSIGTVGQLLTVYSLVFAVGAPIIITLTSKMERKKLLIIAMFVFLIGNLLSIVSPNFAILMVSRIIQAASCGLIIVLSLTLATNLVSPEHKGRAIGMIFMGISGSMMLGVPIGTLIGDLWGWRMTFGLISILTIIVTLFMLRYLPKTAPKPGVPLLNQLKTLKHPKILSAHFISILQMTGQFTIYTYITPFIQAGMGLSTSTISLVLLVYGLGGIFGGWLGGWSSDKLGASKTILITLLVHAVVVMSLPLSASFMITFLLAVVLWCAFNMAPSPAIQSYLIQAAPDSADIQLSLNTSSLHIGLALGSMIGGFLINHYSVMINPLIGGSIILLSLVPAVYSMTRRIETKTVTDHQQAS